MRMSPWTELWFALAVAFLIGLISCWLNNIKQEHTITKLRRQTVVLREICGYKCMEGLMHKPVIKNGIYLKKEVDDNFLFKKTKSISIRAKELEKADLVRINLLHLGTIIEATKKDIKDFRDVKTFNGEVKYYYPIKKWAVKSGDLNWYERYE